MEQSEKAMLRSPEIYQAASGNYRRSSLSGAVISIFLLVMGAFFLLHARLQLLGAILFGLGVILMVQSLGHARTATIYKRAADPNHPEKSLS